MNLRTSQELQETAMHKRLMTVFEALDTKQFQYCLMRDIDDLKQIAGFCEVDLLINKEQFEGFSNLLSELGFVGLPSWGHFPHFFFLTYVGECDGWLKLDVVTEVAYGRPIHGLLTRLADSCLENRQNVSGVFTPSPEDELVSLMLHCVLDKGGFRESHRQRIITLRNQVVAHDHLTNLLMEYWSPGMTWMKIFELIDEERWSLLLADRGKIANYLMNRDKGRYLIHQIRDRVLRRLNRLINSNRPKSITVAILAPDGAGKSSLATGIRDTFYFPTKIIYMGLYQKGVKDRFISRIPGISFLWRLSTQWARYLKARFYQARRRLVIFDRYTYDALLTSIEGMSKLRRFRRWLLANACPAPDLIFVLDAPGELLYKRKGEHSVEFLEKQRRDYKKLTDSFNQMLVIDASQEAEVVRRHVIDLIWWGYLSCQLGTKLDQSVNASLSGFKSKSTLIWKHKS